MKINETIKETLKDYNINVEDGLCFLLGVYYGMIPSYMPPSLQQKVMATNIVKGSLNDQTWNIPLFEEQMTNYGWVKEYVAVFKKLNPDVPGSVTESTRRFKRFFAQNPQYTVEDIKGAVNLYIKSLNDPKYITWPHYFINKDGNSLLEAWLDTYMQTKGAATERKGKSNTMQ